MNLKYKGGQPSVVIPATWYFAKPTAKVFPGPHRFGYPIWDTSKKSYSDLGFDAQGPRTYYAGDPLNASDGTKFAGDQICFEIGQGDQTALEKGQDGTPLECLRDPFGEFIGGFSTNAIPCNGHNVPASYRYVIAYQHTIMDEWSVIATGMVRYTGTGTWPPYPGTLAWTESIRDFGGTAYYPGAFCQAGFGYNFQIVGPPGYGSPTFAIPVTAGRPVPATAYWPQAFLTLGYFGAPGTYRLQTFPL